MTLGELLVRGALQHKAFELCFVLLALRMMHVIISRSLTMTKSVKTILQHQTTLVTRL
ncbi:hypothetical protein D3C87_2132790 [compost metagenome]